MPKYVRIVTSDNKFSRMLALELEAMGALIVSDLEQICPKEKNDSFYTLADLDTCFDHEIMEFAKETTLIGYSHFYASEIPEKSSACDVFLHRPFLMSDIYDIFYDGEKQNKKKPTQRSKKKLNVKYQAHKGTSLSVDVRNKHAVWGDVSIPLSDSEYKILYELCANRGEIVSREKMLKILGSESGNISDVYICHLRRKIENRLGLKLIYTVRGEGYILKN